MQKITSFTIDHLRLVPGVYVSRKDPVGSEIITTFDLRMTSPNDEWDNSNDYSDSDMIHVDDSLGTMLAAMNAFFRFF